VKTPQRFSGKPKRVFGEKPFPRVFQTTFKGFSELRKTLQGFLKNLLRVLKCRPFNY
jgi:hypothetical protein